MKKFHVETEAAFTDRPILSRVDQVMRSRSVSREEAVKILEQVDLDRTAITYEVRFTTPLIGDHRSFRRELMRAIGRAAHRHGRCPRTHGDRACAWASMIEARRRAHTIERRARRLRASAS